MAGRHPASVGMSAKRAPRGFKDQGGASFCHYCNAQLQFKAGGGFYFTRLLTPVDGYPVRVHVDCSPPALADGYKREV